MKKDNCKAYLQKRFKTPFKCVVLYQNPKPYKMYLEHIESEQKAIVWGLKRKSKNGNKNIIRIATVYLGLTPCMAFLMLSQHLTEYIYLIASMLNASVCIAILTSMLYYYSIIKGVKLSSSA